MNLLYKNTKIIATSGPSLTGPLNYVEDIAKHPADVYSSVLNTFESIFLRGVNCIRFNFSHSNTPERLFRLKIIHESQLLMCENAHKHCLKLQDNALKFIRPVSNMCDTKGPEIRVYKIENSQGQKYEKDSIIELHCLEKILGDSQKFSVVDSTGAYNMANDCVVGNKILVDDGKLSLKILESNKSAGIVKVLVENTHILKTNKRINLPGAEYTMPFLSENDISDIKFALDNDFHLIALSFVNKADNVKEVKKILTEHNKNNKKIPAIYSKIETLYSLKNIDEIIEVSDGIMVARGDLGLEIPYYEVPYWTKLIIKKCAIKNIPVIVATQMLDSLERNIIPTRAEVSDVYRAVELGADATMLSGETAQGMFPLISVETMSRIGVESEKRSNYEKFIKYFKSHPKFSINPKLLTLISDAYELIMKNRNSIIGAAVFDSDVSEDFLFAYSAAKLPVSLFVFCKKDSERAAISDVSLCNFNISRNVYKIGVVGANNKTLLSDCASDYIKSHNYSIDEDISGSKILLYINDSWTIQDI